MMGTLVVKRLKASIIVFCTSSDTACPHYLSTLEESENPFIVAAEQNGIVFTEGFKENISSNFSYLLIKGAIIFLITQDCQLPQFLSFQNVLGFHKWDDHVYLYPNYC